MEWGSGTYYSEDMFEDMDYRVIREEALSHTEELGKGILNQSGTATAIASDSYAEGITIKELLEDKAENRIESESARFIGYEVTEDIRRHILKNIDSNEIKLSFPAVDAANNVNEALQRSFFPLDRISGGYIDLRPSDLEEDPEPERYPIQEELEAFGSFEVDHLKPFEESEKMDPENLGWLNLSGIYVMNDDWIMYRNGRDPLGVDKEARGDVYDFLDSLGVGR